MTADNPDEPKILLITHNDPRFADIAAIRRKVFIDEQGVPEDEEWDAIDSHASYLLAYLGDKPVATLRFYPDEDSLHVGRVAVLPECRGTGLGRTLMERCLAEGRRLGFVHSFVSAQSDKADFYRKLGYAVTGDEYIEAGIPHLRMEMDL